jgi:DNA-binding transcriptional regulator YiaG
MRPIEIKQMRKVLGLTQTQLALALGCSIGCVESYEQGKRKPSEVFAERLERLGNKAQKVQAKLDTAKVVK